MARKVKEKPTMDLNLTSMMDVSFQLIIFFILITNFAAADLPELDPPDPLKSVAMEMPEIYRVQINIVPAGESGEAKHLIVLGQKYPRNAYDQVTAILVEKKQEYPELEVYIRADNSLHYEQVQPLMLAITKAGISRINLVAIRQRD